MKECFPTLEEHLHHDGRAQNVSQRCARPQSSTGSSVRRCTAGGCSFISVLEHPKLSVPLCEEHAVQFAQYEGEGWPHDEDGDEHVCQWCSSSAFESPRRVASAQVVLCNACGKAWCHFCINSNLGKNYFQLISTDDNEWQCPYCDSRLHQQLKEQCRP